MKSFTICGILWNSSIASCCTRIRSDSRTSRCKVSLIFAHSVFRQLTSLYEVALVVVAVLAADQQNAVYALLTAHRLSRP